jgi:hypothetical protein
MMFSLGKVGQSGSESDFREGPVVDIDDSLTAKCIEPVILLEVHFRLETLTLNINANVSCRSELSCKARLQVARFKLPIIRVHGSYLVHNRCAYGVDAGSRS